MCNLKRKIPTLLGCIASSILLTSTLALPSFATMSTLTKSYNDKTDPDHSRTLSTSRGFANGIYNYVDGALDINVSYSWDRDFEWIFWRVGNNGVWSIGNTEQDVLDSIKYTEIPPYYWDDDPEGLRTISALEDLPESIKSFYGTPGAYNLLRRFVAVRIDNNGKYPLAAQFDEQPLEWSEEQKGGTTLYSVTMRRYLEYVGMVPIDSVTQSDEWRRSSLSTLLQANATQYEMYYSEQNTLPYIIIGTNTERATPSSPVPENVVYVGVAPNVKGESYQELKPLNPYLQSRWKPDVGTGNDANDPLEGRLKIIFKKVINNHDIIFPYNPPPSD